jgi:hypothetical protein
LFRDGEGVREDRLDEEKDRKVNRLKKGSEEKKEKGKIRKSRQK